MHSQPDTESGDKRELEMAESENEQADQDSGRVATVNVDNYHGLSAKIILVYAVSASKRGSMRYTDEFSVSKSHCLCSVAEPRWCRCGMYLFLPSSAPFLFRLTTTGYSHFSSSTGC